MDCMPFPLGTRPNRNEPMKQAKPCLLPEQDDGTGEVSQRLPPPKPNRKVQWSKDILIVEIESNPVSHDVFLREDDDDDDESYEIEIVDDDDREEEDGEDSNYYYVDIAQVDIVDGEIFFVVETKDDSTVESDESSSSEMGLIAHYNPTLSLTCATISDRECQ